MSAPAPAKRDEMLTWRCANLNRRLAASGRHIEFERRNGTVALDEHHGEAAVRTLRVGTTREMEEFLHAMIVGIDLAVPDRVVLWVKPDAAPQPPEGP